jgi:signal transduction histidine kinase
MIPDTVKNFLIKNKEKQGCFCLAINNQFKIVKAYGKPGLFDVAPPTLMESIYDYFPGILTETFESNFEIPFYNINNKHVCNIYFLKFEQTSYLVFVDKSEIFEVTKKYQQYAHDDNISKNKFKRLALELNKAKQKLKKSNQEKATLIAMLSHELGTPLTSILGYTELLLKNDIETKKGLKIINRNAIYLKHMIENTLLFGSSEAGGIELQIEKISVQSIFNTLKSLLLPAVQNKQLRLQMFHNGNETINIDLTRTQQILINLINNAIKYTEEGSIEIKFNQNKKNYIFSVIDTGLGIPESLKKTIFNPWERIEENSEKGTGIGLYISRNLAQAIGGELKLKYSKPEFGSIFQLILPIAKLPETDSTEQVSNLSKTKGKSILVIDDDYDILELIEALLQTCELKIYTATDFPIARSILIDNEIDIVLTDLNLGVVKASSFVREIKDIKHDLPLLLMSAIPSNKLKENYKTLGFNDVISKPLNSKELIATIVKNL